MNPIVRELLVLEEINRKLNENILLGAWEKNKELQDDAYDCISEIRRLYGIGYMYGIEEEYIKRVRKILGFRD